MPGVTPSMRLICGSVLLAFISSTFFEVTPLSSLAALPPSFLGTRKPWPSYGDVAEIETQRGVARQRPRRGARQDVDFARLHLLEALLGAGRHVLDLLRIAQDRRGDGA